MDIQRIETEFKQLIEQALKVVGRKWDEHIKIEVKKPKEHHLPKRQDYIDEGFMYVYSFWCKEKKEPLKIGKAGPHSPERYISHHYNSHSTKSCLAKSLVDEKNILKSWLSEEELNTATQEEKTKSSKTVHNAIKNNCYRVDVQIKFDNANENGHDIFVLELIEAVLHCKYKPIFEGYENQRP